MKNPSLAITFDQFLQHGKIIKNFQPATIASYRSAFRLFFKMTKAQTVKDLTPELIERFLYDGRIDRHWSVCTFRTYHKQLRAFSNWCVKKNLLPSNPTDNIERPPLEKKLPDYLTADEANRLLETTYHLKYTYKLEHIRNRALLGIMIFAGLRLSEVANLKRLDVDLHNEVISVRQGKWQKDRQIPIAARLMYFLTEYVDAIGQLPHNHISFFSCINKDRPLGKMGICRICTKIEKRTGIKFSPQKLRRTFATHTYMGSKDIYAVSGLLGHAKVETTQIYAHLSLASKRESIDQNILNQCFSP